MCSQGKCGSSCSGGDTLCTPDRGKASCANLQTDSKNCGACGNACANGGACTAGKCPSNCSGGLASCGDAGACVDTETDNNNCGGCGNTCLPSLQSCTAGQCASTCTNKTLCIPDGGAPSTDAGTDAGDGGGAPAAHCADLQADNGDCGSCFNACTTGQTCTAGICKAILLGSGTATDPWHTQTPLTNCAAYLAAIPSATDGVYTTHPASSDIGVYCDMTHGGITFEDFGFGQYTATYTGYTWVGSSDFTGTTQFDAAFAYLYTRNGGLTNIKPSGWSCGNCCIQNTSGNPRFGLAGSTYMQPANGTAVNCSSTYSAAIIQLYPEPSGPGRTSFTAQEAGNVGTSTTCGTTGNPGIFVKKY